MNYYFKHSDNQTFLKCLTNKIIVVKIYTNTRGRPKIKQSYNWKNGGLDLLDINDSIQTHPVGIDS